MFSKVVALCAFVAVAQAGLLAAPAHYSSAAAVSSQSIVRHDQPAPVAKLAVAAPVYHAAPAPVAYHAAPAAVTYHAAPAPVAYHAAPAVAYHAAPVAKVLAHEEIAHPKYEYTYSVADGHTGDNKSQQESRDGDVVKGSYSFHEADGSIRTVEYTADDHNGFNAVVHNTAPTAAPVVVKAAPVVYKAAPVVYKAAPALQYYHHFISIRLVFTPITMFSKVVALCAFVAVAQAGLLAAPAHYSSAAAVSSQSIVRHDQPAPVAKLAVAAPVYHAAPAPVAYHAAPAAVTYHAAPAPVAYHAAPAVAYHAAPVAKVLAHEEIAHPKYEYTYSVADGHTGDNKSQQESRDGDVVKGSYSFHEADGSIRTVEYTADDHNGFNAVVHNTAPTAAPVVVKAAPVVYKAAPVVYKAAPALQYYHHYCLVISCRGWEEQRRVLTAVVGQDLSLPSLVNAFLGSERCWKAVASFCEKVILQKEAAERERENDPLATSLRRRRRSSLAKVISIHLLITHLTMFTKVVALCAFVAVAQAGLLAAPAHYSSAAAVSSQSIVRHDQPAPVAKLAVAAPVYHAAPAPVAYHAAPAAVTYHAAPAPVAYHAAPAVAYHAAPVAKVLAHEEIAHPKYEYTYSVADGHTGDNKSQQESRDGDVVKGSYSFHEADGSIRTVEYTADDHNGFNAVVHNTAPTAAPVVVKAAPVVYKAAPALQYYHH
ncbi:uncharacterized protein LOC135071373 [Ostrinia nubilalis]|uniref:uncharacterized protein LOC135071373 n=1 Tax=Ostrinia nubilalis TaxID=29057 RepID=UPI0030824D9D